MKIDSPSSITPREVSIRLEWISTRILPGIAVLLLSIPLCQWADSNLPDDIVPVYVIYMMSVTVLWSLYLAVQYAFVGIAQTRKTKTHACKNQTATNDSSAEKPILLLEAMPVVNEPNATEDVCDAVVVEEITEDIAVTDTKVISEEVYSKKRKEFLLFCSRLFVTLALPKLLALGSTKEKHAFLLHFSRFFVTLQPNSENDERILASAEALCASL